MNSPFETSEKRSFRRVFLLIVLAHIALASLPIAWLKFGTPAPISAGKPKLREEDVTWIDPALLAEQPKAAPEVSPAPPPVVEEAPPPPPKTSTVLHRVKETPRIAKTSFQKPKAPAPEQHKSPPRPKTPTEKPEPVAKTEFVKSAPIFTGPAIFDAAAEDAIQSYHAKIQKLMEQQWHQPAGITSDSAPTAKIAITVTRSGQIIDTRLSGASGLDAVDRSALEAVRSVGQIAPLPTAIPGDTYQLVIRFVLH